MPFPIDDWQFWVVTGAAALAALWLLRGVWPISLVARGARRRSGARRAVLTVNGRPVSR